MPIARSTAALPVRAVAPNAAHLRARDARIVGPYGAWSVDVPALQADVLDVQGRQPLDMAHLERYKLRVQGGTVRVGAWQATELVNSFGAVALAKLPVSHLHVAMQGPDEVAIDGSYRMLGVKLPFTLKYKVQQASDSRITLTPNFSAATKAVLATTGFEPAALVPKELANVIKGGPGHALSIDLAGLPNFEGKLAGVSVGKDALELKLGTPVDVGTGAPQLDFTAEGAVQLEHGIFRNGTARVVDKPNHATPIAINNWAEDGIASPSSGDIVLNAESVKYLMGRIDPAFQDLAVTVDGDHVSATGHYQYDPSGVIGLFGLLFGGERGLMEVAAHANEIQPIQRDVAFRVRLGAATNGGLLITPEEGTGATSRSSLGKNLAKLPGARREGDGVVLDLATLAGVEPGKVKAVRSEDGQLVIQTGG